MQGRSSSPYYVITLLPLSFINKKLLYVLLLAIALDLLLIS